MEEWPLANRTWLLRYYAPRLDARADRRQVSQVHAGGQLPGALHTMMNVMQRQQDQGGWCCLPRDSGCATARQETRSWVSRQAQSNAGAPRQVRRRSAPPPASQRLPRGRAAPLLLPGRSGWARSQRRCCLPSAWAGWAGCGQLGKPRTGQQGRVDSSVGLCTLHTVSQSATCDWS